MSDEKKKIPVRVLDVALHDPWALLPEALPPILKIAARENPGIEVLQDELGVQLDGAIEATVVDGIAIVPVVGPIFRRANLFTELSGATSLDIVGNDLRVAIDNDEVRGIILDVDSPGGQVNGISEAAQLIASYGKVKPIYAHIDGFGASGAYWLASAAEVVVASDTSLIGSIGVISTHDVPDGDGRTIEIVSSQSPHKTLDVMDKTGRKRVQTMVDDMAQVFVDSVARYRGVSAEKVLKDFGKGDVLIANRAVKAGMIDGVGTFQQTFDALLAKCSGKKHRRSTSAVVDREASLSSFSTYLQQTIARSETGNWSAASGGWHSNIEDMSFTLQHTGLSDGAPTTNIVTDAAHNEPVTELEPQPDNSPAATAATEVDNMENENKTAEAVQKERGRVAAVLALGAEWAEYGGNEIAAKAVKDGKSEEDTRREIMDAVKKTKKDEGVITPAAEKVKVGKDREAEAPFASMGEQLCAIAKAGRGGAIDRRLHHLNAQFTAATGHSEAVPSEGGFLLQPTFLGGIEKLMHDIGQVLRRCNMRPIGAGSNALVYNVIDETSRADGSRRGGIRGYWVNEAVAVTKSKLKIRQDRLALEKLGALCYVTEEQLQDTVSLEAEIRESVPEELTFKLEDAIINGTGAGQPLGVLTAAAKVSIDKETGQAAATVLFANISKMWARFWSRSMSSPVAAWFINQDVLTELDNMVLAVGTGGLPAYLPPGGLNDTPYARLKGLPVVPIEYCQTLGTVGDIILADFSQYRVINKGGVQSASSMHVKFEEGETAFRFTYRTNGQPLWESALTPKNGTNTVAPFVVLAERA